MNNSGASPSNDLIEETACEYTHFRLTDFSYPGKFQIIDHVHENAIFCMAYEGGCEEKFGRTRRRFTPRSISFLPAGQSHSLVILEPGMRSFSVSVSQSWLEAIHANSADFATYVFREGGVLVELSQRLMWEFHTADAFTALAAEGLALEMLAELARAETRERYIPRWLRRAVDTIHDQAETPLSLSELALAVGVHPVHLARSFRRTYGCTFGEYARRIRIERACQLMAATDIQLAEVAAKYGFYDQSHFARVFKQVKGVTPNQYRNRFTRS